MKGRGEKIHFSSGPSKEIVGLKKKMMKMMMKMMTFGSQDSRVWEFSLTTALINTYRALSELYVDGDALLSCEGTTRGDPLTMPTYSMLWLLFH